MNDSFRKLLSPDTAAYNSIKTGLVVEDAVAPKDELQSWTKDYELCFVNTMHMYLRIPVSLFELYAKEFNKPINVTHIVLPTPLLIEDAVPSSAFAPPEPGWSKYLHAIPKDQWPEFKNWMANSKWLATTKEGSASKVLYDCEIDEIQVRDPVKMQTMQIVGIKEFVKISFFMPGNMSARLHINLKNGPPFNCSYVSRNGAGAGEAAALFSKLREVS